MMIYFGFLLLPFIQLGINWWIGIPLVSLLIVIVSLDFKNTPNIDFRVFGLLTWFIVLITAINSSGDTRDLLRAFREMLVLLLIILALSPIEFKKKRFNPDKVITILCFVSTLVLFLTFFQFVLIRSGHTISLPESWYPRKLFTATALDFKYSHIRPSATFTEPSYLGLFSFAFLVTGVLLKAKYLRANFLIYSSLATIALSQSKSGIFFSILFFLAIIISKLKKEKIESLNISTIAILIFILGITTLLFSFQRLNDSASIRDRILIPARIVFDFFLTHPFGIPYYERLEMPVLQIQTANWFQLSHNGLLNLIFDYGIFGLLIIIVLTLSLRNNGLLLLLFIYLGIQNGSFLDFDKAVVVLYLVILLRSSKSLSKFV